MPHSHHLQCLVEDRHAHRWESCIGTAAATMSKLSSSSGASLPPERCHRSSAVTCSAAAVSIQHAVRDCGVTLSVSGLSAFFLGPECCRNM